MKLGFCEISDSSFSHMWSLRRRGQWYPYQNRMNEGQGGQEWIQKPFLSLPPPVSLSVWVGFVSLQDSRPPIWPRSLFKLIATQTPTKSYLSCLSWPLTTFHLLESNGHLQFSNALGLRAAVLKTSCLVCQRFAFSPLKNVCDSSMKTFKEHIFFFAKWNKSEK